MNIFLNNMTKCPLSCFLYLILLYHNSVVAMGVVQEKAESATPVTTFSPPEGNTTFLGGTTWCVASAGASQGDLQNALDWACGLGMADCSPIQEGGACFEPDTLLSHASYAFNNYYQQNGNSDIACNFGGTAALTARDPSNSLPPFISCLFNQMLHKIEKLVFICELSVPVVISPKSLDISCGITVIG